MEEYQVVHANTINDLQKRVTALLNDGWVCQGGIDVYLDETGYSIFYQAMVR